jgi:putative RNA 2'-phosphotransferase
MDTKRAIHLSKFLSLVLRHKPEAIGITLDSGGWVNVAELLAATDRHGQVLSLDELRGIVTTSDKKRFAFSEDGQKIRASQGHSVQVDLGYQPSVPPERLYHGTVERFLDRIRRDGLLKGRRHHVHLSIDRPTAARVGERRGKPVILIIRAGDMHRYGLLFCLSANGVWLTEHVPARYIEFPG